MPGFELRKAREEEEEADMGQEAELTHLSCAFVDFSSKLLFAPNTRGEREGCHCRASYCLLFCYLSRLWSPGTKEKVLLGHSGIHTGHAADVEVAPPLPCKRLLPLCPLHGHA